MCAKDVAWEGKTCGRCSALLDVASKPTQCLCHITMAVHFCMSQQHMPAILYPQAPGAAPEAGVTYLTIRKLCTLELMANNTQYSSRPEIKTPVIAGS